MGLHLRPHDPRHWREPDVERVRQIGHLSLRNEHLRSWLAVETAIARVTHDADDLAFRFVRELAHDAAPDDQPFADRACLRPVLLRHCLVDEDNRLSMAVVALDKRASLLHRDLEYLEVAWRHRHPAAA